jgi:hypothetical protein
MLFFVVFLGAEVDENFVVFRESVDSFLLVSFRLFAVPCSAALLGAFFATRKIWMGRLDPSRPA